MSKLFSQVQFNRIPKAKFDLSHEKKLSLKMGKLVPIFCQEILPGDSFRVSTELLIRLQPLVAPVMHRLQVKTDFFFVPNRLVYDKWTEFITGGEKGNSAEIAPYIKIGPQTPSPLQYGVGSLWDYFGLPPTNPSAHVDDTKVNALPFRAYQLIYNEYFRDQNLIDPVVFSKAGGAETNQENIMTMRSRAWEKDYFTSALPFAQKGAAVELPTDINYKPTSTVRKGDGSILEGALGSDPFGTLEIGANPTGNDTARIENIDSLGTTVNDLRVAVRLQEWLEKNARAGSRYIESILAHFGVLGKDARLQRPEYLGGGMNPIVISEVLSTFQTADDTGYPQGSMKGHGIGTGNMMGFKKSFDEHGFIIGLCTIIPKTSYQQGIPKEFSRFDKLDYAWPSFAQLGEQEIKRKEIWYRGDENQAANDVTFGYQSRYAEYKYKPSTVHGEFRNTLNFWHMGRIFAAEPQLNGAFVTSDPTKRVFAVETQNEDEILMQLYHRIDAIRPLPYFNQPTL